MELNQTATEKIITLPATGFMQPLPEHSYRCPLCIIPIFITSAVEDMKEHILLSHVPLFPWHCKGCDHRFLEKRHIDEHIEQHHDNNPYYIGNDGNGENLEKVNELVEYAKWHFAISKRQKMASELHNNMIVNSTDSAPEFQDDLGVGSASSVGNDSTTVCSSSPGASGASRKRKSEDSANVARKLLFAGSRYRH